MRPLSVLICGGDRINLHRMAQALKDDGVKVETSHQPLDRLYGNQMWDFLVVDLDGLNSFLRSLLPGILQNYPNLSVVGVSTKNSANEVLNTSLGLRLDACLNRIPRAEDLITCSPRVAAQYLSDTQPLH
jgi:hypothetical protein